MSEKFRAKVIVIGPPRVGKTLISNFLAGLSKTVTEDYHPTVGARFRLINVLFTFKGY